MGNVKDRYFKYAENGDQFVGRCLALLPVLNVNLAISPPYFTEKADTEWINNMVIVQYSAFRKLREQFGLLLRMCLASMLFHKRWIAECLSFNHVVKTSSVCFRNGADLEKVEQEKWVITSYPWSAPDLSFTGIPPYCVVLQNVMEVKSEQKSFILEFGDKVKQALTEYGVNSGSLSEERVQAIMNEFYSKFDGQLNR